jgi:lysozyme family protein
MVDLYNNSMNRSAIIDDIILSEGSDYTNRSNDYGGPTKYGITIEPFSKFLGQQITAEDISHINRETAVAFYNWLFEQNQASQIPEVLQHAFFDSTVLDGFGGASGFLQMALIKLGQPITVDYGTGPLTIAATKKVNAKALLTHFLDEREAYYRNKVKHDPTQAENLDGWINRVERLRKNG